MEITKDLIIETLTEKLLKPTLIGAMYGRRMIADVEIIERDPYGSYYSNPSIAIGGQEFDISILTVTKSGKTKDWINLPIY